MLETTSTPHKSLEKACKQCKKIFQKPKTCGLPEWSGREYCSRLCVNQSKKGILTPALAKYAFKKGSEVGRLTRFKKGITPWNKDKKDYLTKKAKLNIAKGQQVRFSKMTHREKQKQAEGLLLWREKNTKVWIQAIRRASKKRQGDKNPLWKDENATYNTKHKWIQRHWIKTGICEECGAKPIARGRRRWGTEWSNQSGEYRRNDRTDWRELCKKCHIQFDKKV